MAKNVLMSNTNDVIYIYIPKCACTTLKTVICNMEPNIKLKLTGQESSRQVEGIFAPYVRNIPYPKLVQFNQKNFTIFSFIREPIARIKSLYKEKVCDYLFEPFKQMGIKKNMPFKKFVEKISKVPDKNANSHFRSQYTFLTGPNNKLIPFIKIGLVENLQNDLKIILGEKYDHSFENLHYRKTKSQSVIVDEETKIMLQNRYKEDLLIYNFFKNKVFDQFQEINKIIKNKNKISVDQETINKKQSILKQYAHPLFDDIFQRTLSIKLDRNPLRSPKNLNQRSVKKNLNDPKNKTFIAKQRASTKYQGVLDRKFLEEVKYKTSDILKFSKQNIIIVTFSDSKYIKTLKTWYSYISKNNIQNYIVIAADEQAYNIFNKWNINTAYVPKHYKTNFWIYRSTVLQYLIAEGFDTLHSDADAFWYNNPMDYINKNNHDLLLSTGTCLPMIAYQKWKFTICCGFMLFRSTPNVRIFVSKWLQHMRRTFDDQVSINTLLLNTNWIDNGTGIMKKHKVRSYCCYSETLEGYNKDFKVSVGLIPMFMVQRFYLGPKGFVYHLIDNKQNKFADPIKVKNENAEKMKNEKKLSKIEQDKQKAEAKMQKIINRRKIKNNL